jgi:hypothetical protein
MIQYKIQDYAIMKLKTCTENTQIEQNMPQLKPLIHDLSNTCLNSEEKEELCQLLDEFRDTFTADISELGEAKGFEAEINLTSDEPIRCRPYRVPYTMREILDQQLQKLKEANIIRESNSNFSSPVLLIPKANQPGQYRVVADLRRVNTKIKVDSFPLPNIQEIIASISKPKYFSCCDLDQAYYQIPLKEEFRHYFGIVTHNYQWEFNRLPQGCVNSAQIFQRIMTQLLRGHTKALPYLDDVILWSDSWQEHKEHLREFFIRLKAANLKPKPSKCSWATNILKFLGFQLTSEGAKADPDKISAIADFPTPKNVRELRGFLGITSIHRRLIKNYAHIARPLQELLKKSVKFQWSTETECAFQTLKNALISEPVLAYPDFTRQFKIHTDASGFSLGHSLLEEGNDGLDHPILNGGRSLTKSEKNYSATESEALAVITALKANKFYLYGAKPFKIITDHAALQWLFSKAVQETLSGRLSRWITTLQQYSYTIEHRSGKKHLDADGLSRRPYAQESKEHHINHLWSEGKR